MHTNVLSNTTPRAVTIEELFSCGMQKELPNLTPEQYAFILGQFKVVKEAMSKLAEQLPFPSAICAQKQISEASIIWPGNKIIEEISTLTDTELCTKIKDNPEYYIFVANECAKPDNKRRSGPHLGFIPPLEKVNETHQRIGEALKTLIKCECENITLPMLRELQWNKWVEFKAHQLSQAPSCVSELLVLKSTNNDLGNCTVTLKDPKSYTEWLQKGNVDVFHIQHRFSNMIFFYMEKQNMTFSGKPDLKALDPLFEDAKTMEDKNYAKALAIWVDNKFQFCSHQPYTKGLKLQEIYLELAKRISEKYDIQALLETYNKSYNSESKAEAN